MILNCLGQESTEYSNAFNDVTKDDWYSNIVQTISELGIIIGENRQFYPNFGVTREEAATIIMRVYKYVTNIEYQANTNSDIFSDYYEFSEWAVNPIYSCYELNILRGETTNFFSPKRYLTKAEAAVIIVRLQNILY